MKTETIMWLFPIVFMFHDFEEVIMMSPWVAKNAEFITQRFPRLAARMLPHFRGLTTSSFALAVALMFLIVSTVTLISVELDLYALWTGVLIGYFIHLVVHIGQFVVVRRYVPVVVTSFITAPYCVWAFLVIRARCAPPWGETILWAAAAVVVIAVSVPLAHALAARFQRWLETGYGAE
jgi:hypothetical protein